MHFGTCSSNSLTSLKIWCSRFVHTCAVFTLLQNKKLCVSLWNLRKTRPARPPAEELSVILPRSCSRQKALSNVQLLLLQWCNLTLHQLLKWILFSFLSLSRSHVSQRPAGLYLFSEGLHFWERLEIAFEAGIEDDKPESANNSVPKRISGMHFPTENRCTV